MMSSLRRLGALAGAAALVLGLAACTDATSSSSSSAPADIDYSACSTDDSAEQNTNVDRSGKGNFPSVSGDDTPRYRSWLRKRADRQGPREDPQAGRRRARVPGRDDQGRTTWAPCGTAPFLIRRYKKRRADRVLTQPGRQGLGLRPRATRTSVTVSSSSFLPRSATAARLAATFPRTRPSCSSSTSSVVATDEPGRRVGSQRRDGDRRGAARRHHRHR